MPHRTAVIDIVGLTTSLLGDAMPKLTAFADRGRVRRLRPVLPALTCPVQASMVTGLTPREHGIVGNGWYDRDLAEVHFWKQSNRLIRGEKVWETARRRDPSVTTAVLFWWFNMYSSAEYTVTPRPIYKADGRKVPDCYSEPPELRETLQERLGRFPLMRFWGPGASIPSSRWIADAAMHVERTHEPTLSLVYLPHLDYALQRLGPDDPAAAVALTEIDRVAGNLIEHLEERGVRVMVVSEYGIEAVHQPVHLNRVLREAGWLRVRNEEGGELLDPGASTAFAVCDHQVAHVYIEDASRIDEVAATLRNTTGVEVVHEGKRRKSVALDHENAGELVVVAEPGCWFTYYYWLDDRHAPDFARTVDIHRKPGYDPVELFIDPLIRFPTLSISRKLLARKAGFRTLLDVIGLDATVVRGSHGRIPEEPDLQPLLISRHANTRGPDEIPCQGVRDVILGELF